MLTSMVAFASPTLVVAWLLQFLWRRPWLIASRMLLSLMVVMGPPALAWNIALTSLGSGWGFGLIALILSAASFFGAIMGWIWFSLSRRA